MARRESVVLWSDQIAGSVLNKRLSAVELGAFYTGALFQIAIVDAQGVTALSCRIYGSLDGVRFPAPGSTAEALVSQGNVLAIGTGILRQPAVLVADGAPSQYPRIFPSFLLLEYTATIALAGRLQLEVSAYLEAGNRVAGVEQEGEPAAVIGTAQQVQGV